MAVPPATLAQRQGFLAARRVRGETITYTNGSITLTGLMAIKSRPESNQADASENVVFESKEWHFLIDPEDLLEDGTKFEPAIGHVITGQDGTRYKVQPVGTFSNCFRWSDGLRTFLRVYAVEQ